MPAMLQVLTWSVSVSLLLQLTSRVGAEPIITLQPVRMPNGNVELQCTTSGDQFETAAIRLGCDIRSSKVCRENCTLFCPLIDGHRNCTGMSDDGVISCRYSRPSESTARVVYELGSVSANTRVNFWCIYLDKSSPIFTHTSLKKKSGRAGALSRPKKLKSAPQAKELQHPNPGGDAAKLQMHFTAEVVFIIAVCTIGSCLLNLIFCICCQISRRYLKGLAKGGPRNSATETCLCLKSLADTYRPRRFGFARSGHRRGGEGGRSSAQWNRMAPQGSFKLPLTEPTPRRKPLTALAYFPSYHHEPLCPPSDPPQPSPEEVIYDDVHQSTIYLNKGELASQQNLGSEAYPTGAPGSPGSGQNYIVDQNGMVYLAMGHVSQTPQQMRSNLAASRVTLTTFQPDNTSKLDQQSQGRRNSSHSGQLPSLHNPPSTWAPRKESNDAIQKTSNVNLELPGLPPQPLRVVPLQCKTKMPSVQSSLNPPIPFADQANNNDDFDDIFDMSKDTLLPRRHNTTKKPNPEPL
ncbi:hypothetical protein TcWFU_000159 [Taenia crassiceps]|uniref:Uncharacterized protein n=1 Tax=Taenia crassiceps TaxID=6207 RepID=A0ABR4QC37_9CEST